MGIVYSGNFYVPIDPTMPAKRIELILDTLQPVMILSAAEGKTIEGREVYTKEDCFAAEIDRERLAQIRMEALDTDPLYAIFTSGSTGTPKGVLISHRSVIDLVEQFAITFPFPEKPVFGNQAPLDFDVDNIFSASEADLYTDIPAECCPIPA